MLLSKSEFSPRVSLRSSTNIIIKQACDNIGQTDVYSLLSSITLQTFSQQRASKRESIELNRDHIVNKQMLHYQFHVQSVRKMSIYVCELHQVLYLRHLQTFLTTTTVLSIVSRLCFEPSSPHLHDIDRLTRLQMSVLISYDSGTITFSLWLVPVS